MNKYDKGFGTIGILVALLVIAGIGFWVHSTVRNSSVPATDDSNQYLPAGEGQNPNATIGSSATPSPDTTSTNQTQNPVIDCPMYSSPAPGWCSDGTVLPPIKDKNGCNGPPRCERNN